MMAKKFRRVFGLTLVILLILTSISGIQAFATDRNTGTLTVTKVVDNFDGDQTEFNFNVYIDCDQHDDCDCDDRCDDECDDCDGGCAGGCDDGCSQDPVWSFTLKHGESKSKSLPVGNYTVVEEPNRCYTTCTDEIHVVIPSRRTIEITFYNTLKPSILKIEKEVPEFCEDDTIFFFDIYEQGTRNLVLGDIETTDEHYAEVELLPGDYTVVERPTDWYEVEGSYRQDITILQCPCRDLTITFVNHPYGAIEVFKDVPQLEEDPTMFTFEIYEIIDDQRSLVDTVETKDEHSTAVRVPEGEYYVYEVPMEGYDTTTPSQIVMVMSGEVSDVYFENNLTLGGIDIHKDVPQLDEDPTMFTFEIYEIINDQRSLVKTVETKDEHSTAVRVPEGEYYVYEVPEEGYVTTTPTQMVVVVPLEVSHVYFENNLDIGGIKVFKDVPEIEGDPTVFSFDIYEMTTGGRVFETTVTTTDEHSTAIRVEPGSYAAYEHNEEGYTPEEQTILFDVIQGEITEVHFVNERDIGAIDIFKHVPEIRGDQTPFTFEIYQIGDNGRILKDSWTVKDEESSARRFPTGEYYVYEVPEEGYTPEERTQMVVVEKDTVSPVDFYNHIETTTGSSLTIYKDVPRVEEDPTVFEFNIFEIIDEVRYPYDTVFTTDENSILVPLPPGHYAVWEQDTTGYTPEEQLQYVEIGEGNEDLTFTNYKEIEEEYITVHGYVFEDNDEDNNKDSGEDGIDNITVCINFEIEVETNSNGYYTYDLPFEEAYDLTIEVCDSIDEDQVSEHDGTLNEHVDFYSGEYDEQLVNFGYEEPRRSSSSSSSKDYTLSGYVFEDNNGNNTKDGEDFGYEGVTVELFKNDSLLKTTTTDSAGKYKFTDLKGNYTIVIDPLGELPGDFNITEQVSEYDDSLDQIVEVSISKTTSLVNFGYIATPLAMPTIISGTVFRDPDADNMVDMGEVGYSNVEVSLWDGAYLVMTKTTDTSGQYVFNFAIDPELAGLEAGSYVITIGDTPVDVYQVSEYDGAPFNKMVILTVEESTVIIPNVNFGFNSAVVPSGETTQTPIILAGLFLILAGFGLRRRKECDY
jgi:hypothetical protein